MKDATTAATFWALSLTFLSALFIGCTARVKIPEINGRVVDARSGAPIADAIVKRRLYGPTPINLVDGSRPFPVKGGDFGTRSRADGTFVLPAFGARGLAGMDWMVYAPGWMPLEANSLVQWSPDGCPGLEVRGEDPWISAKFTKSRNHLDLEVRLLPPTLKGVVFRTYNTFTKQWVPYTPSPEDSDPWAHYFERLRGLASMRFLPRNVLISEGSAYMAGRLPLSDRIAAVFAEAVGTPIKDRPVPADYDPQVLQLRLALLNYCDQTPKSELCGRSAIGMGYIREFYRKGDTNAK